MLNTEELDSLLRTSAGIERIVIEHWKEEDNLDFKREVNRREPKWENDLRGDCAALATIGVGFLAIGIDESRDGHSVATAISPVQDPVDLKTAIEHRLAAGLSPPLKRWEVWIVDTTKGPVVIVRVEGEVGYPVEVLALSERRHFLRAAARNQKLTPEEARLRRREIDLATGLKEERTRFLGFIILTFLIIGSAAVINYRKRATESQLTVDADMCGFLKKDGGLLSIDNDVWLSKIDADIAILKNNPSDCERLHKRLINAHPDHAWRYFWEGQCERLNRNPRRAHELFLLSEQVAIRATAKRPNCEIFKTLRAISLYASNHQEEACELLKGLHKEGVRTSRDSHPPMTRMEVACPNMDRELSELGLKAPRHTPQTGDSMLWPVNEEQRSKMLKRVADSNAYEIQLCLKAFPPASSKLPVHYVINQAGDIEDLGPTGDIHTPQDKLYMGCHIELSRHWQFPPHSIQPSVDLFFPIHFQPE